MMRTVKMNCNIVSSGYIVLEVETDQSRNKMMKYLSCMA